MHAVGTVINRECCYVSCAMPNTGIKCEVKHAAGYSMLMGPLLVCWIKGGYKRGVFDTAVLATGHGLNVARREISNILTGAAL